MKLYLAIIGVMSLVAFVAWSDADVPYISTCTSPVAVLAFVRELALWINVRKLSRTDTANGRLSQHVEVDVVAF